jgi:hypothetical protein
MAQLLISWTVKGEIVLIMDDGTETHLKNPGDVVVQKGTAHARKTLGTDWTRLATVLVDGKYAVVNGQELGGLWRWISEQIEQCRLHQVRYPP